MAALTNNDTYMRYDRALANGWPIATGMIEGACRYDHRLKQHPRWKVEQVTPGTFRWTAPSGRQYTTEPTRYPI